MISLTPVKVRLLIAHDIVEMGTIGMIMDLHDLLYDVYFQKENIHLYLNINEFEKI